MAVVVTDVNTDNDHVQVTNTSTHQSETVHRDAESIRDAMDRVKDA